LRGLRGCYHIKNPPKIWVGWYSSSVGKKNFLGFFGGSEEMLLYKFSKISE